LFFSSNVTLGGRISSPNGDASRTLKNGYTCDGAQRLFAPTGRSFKIPSSIICRVENRLIIEVPVYHDVLGLMTQLGLGP